MNTTPTGSPYGTAPWLAYLPAIGGGALIWLALFLASGHEPVPYGHLLVITGLVLLAVGTILAVTMMVIASLRQWPTNGRLWLPAAAFPVTIACILLLG